MAVTRPTDCDECERLHAIQRDYFNASADAGFDQDSWDIYQQARDEYVEHARRCDVRRRW